MRQQTICALIVMLLSSNSTANPFSLSNESSVDYTRTPHEAKMRCKDLISTSNYDYSVLSAVEIPATENVPAHCRVSGLVPSEVRFEVNLPIEWNGRIYMFGNGGLAGRQPSSPNHQASRDLALANGFATTYTDTGHDARVTPGGTFAHNNLHRLVDYGFRAVHLTITSTKQIVRDFFDRSARTSYWNGCSTGGRQAMLSAQRFPDDFDGIIAGAPAADYSGLKFSQAWRVAAISNSGLTEDEVLVLADHIYEQCDALDGMADGLISDPRRCDFNVDRDLPHCDGEDTDACFDNQERDALKRYYAPVTLGDEVIYPAMPVGSEVLGSDFGGNQRSGWNPWLINDNGPVLLDLLGSDFFRYMAYVEDRPEYDWTEFDFAEAPDNLDEFRAIVDAIDPDLSGFKQSGGKLLSYFGWADPDINPLTLIAYREQVLALDPDAEDYFRTFLMPGMFHCRGGAGPDRFDAMTALIDWTEKDVAPEQLMTWKDANGQMADQRPSCRYPAEARISGGQWTCVR